MNRVIVSFANGEEKTGKVVVFNTQKKTIHLEIENDDGQTGVQMIQMDDVKKIAFLKKDTASTSNIHYETIDQSTFAGPIAFKLNVEFQDGELLIGSAMKYNPEDTGFFFIPLNPADQNERIYVNSQHIKRVDCKRLLGKQLVDNQQISESQLNEALRIQTEQRNKKIGSIMIEETMISQNQLEQSLHKQKERNIKLGELLFESGYITQKQLEKALLIQKEYRKKRLGQILVALKYLMPNDICLALATQLGYAWVDLSTLEISDEIIGLLPVKAIKFFEVIPVGKKDSDVLIVASAQPNDPEMQKTLTSLTNYKLEFVIAYDGYIFDLIKKRFPS